jgi:hypothetical protein
MKRNVNDDCRTKNGRKPCSDSTRPRPRNGRRLRRSTKLGSAGCIGRAIAKPIPTYSVSCTPCLSATLT